MRYSNNKRFAFVLTLFLGVMQLLLPFIHAHYNGHDVHVQNKTPLLHMHNIQVHTPAPSLALGVFTAMQTALVADNLDSAFVDIGQGVPNQSFFDAAHFIAVLFAIIFFVTVTRILYFPALSIFKQHFPYQRPLSHAPPNP